LHHQSARADLRRGVCRALPLLALFLSLGAGGCSHDAPTGRRVTSDTVVATFDPVDPAYRSLVLSPRPHGVAGALSWHFDVVDVDDNRLDGLKTQWQSSDPAVVTPLFSDVNTRTTNGRWETAVDLRALAPGDAVVTGQVVGARTKDGLPVTVALNVHVTGPGTSLATMPALPAGLVDPEPHRRALGQDLVAAGAIALDAAGERIVGAKLDWACVGAAADAELAASDSPGHWSGAGCSLATTDAIGPYVYVRGYRAGLFGFRVWLDGAPEVSALVTVAFLDPGADPRVHLELSPPAVATVAGGQRQVTGVLVDGDGARYLASNLSLESRDPAVADHTGDIVMGIVSGDLPGQTASTTFAATAGPLSAELSVVVYRAPASVVVAPALVLAPATQGMVSALLVDTDGVTLIPPDATTLAWSTVDPAVATAAPVGAGDTALIDAVATGMTAVLVTTAEGMVGTSPVTVAGPGDLVVTGGGGAGSLDCPARPAGCP